MPIGRTRASGSARCTASTKRGAGRPSARGPRQGVLVDRFGADHELRHGNPPRTRDPDMEQHIRPRPSYECARGCGGGLDRADPADERRCACGTRELALGCGDDEDHAGNRSRVTSKGEPVQGLPEASQLVVRSTFAASRPYTAVMTTREPPTAGAALAFHTRVTLKGDFSVLLQDPPTSGVSQ